MKRNLAFLVALLVVPFFASIPSGMIVSAITGGELGDAMSRAFNYFGGLIIGALIWDSKP